MKNLLSSLRALVADHEPAIVAGVLQIATAAAARFGLGLSAVQTFLVSAITTALLTAFVRQNVTSNATLQAR